MNKNKKEKKKKFSEYALIVSINPSLVYAKHLICAVHTFAYLP